MDVDPLRDNSILIDECDSPIGMAFSNQTRALAPRIKLMPSGNGLEDLVTNPILMVPASGILSLIVLVDKGLFSLSNVVCGGRMSSRKHSSVVATGQSTGR